MRESVHKKLSGLGTTTPFTEPHESYTKTLTGASSVDAGKTSKPVGTGVHPGRNLGKFLHSRGATKPAHELNGTVDAHTGGVKVRPGY